MATIFNHHSPVERRSFTTFLRLPIEIRHRIWETYLSEPGIHFVKLKICDVSHTSDMVPLHLFPRETVAFRHQEGVAGGSATALDAVDLMVIQRDFNPQPLRRAKLVAHTPEWRADGSHYKVLHRQLARLSETCRDSANLVRSLVSRPGVLRMDNGNIVTLDGSPDLVLLAYLPYHIYKLNFTLDFRLFCPGLAAARRVAVRFSHDWKPARSAQRLQCATPTHDNGTRTYPIHLYQFLARYLPNLEEFYFVDYFAVPSDDQQGQSPADLSSVRDASQPLRVFRAKDRNFCEIVHGHASASKWKVGPEIFEVRDWLRDHFLRYARASHTSRHQKPERVYFGVLACEWKIERPAVRFKAPPTRSTQLGARPKPARPKPAKPKPAKPKSAEPTPAAKDSWAISETWGPEDISVFQFGSDRRNSFNFTFRKGYGSLARWASP